MEDVQTFSVVNFYRTFKARIEKIDTYPLSLDNLIVHQDLVKMLGDDEIEFTQPFASLVMDRPRSFTDLLFTLEFYASSFIISIDQQPPLEISYDALHLNEEELASALVDILIGLANGQIIVLTTMIDEEDAQAVEILYKQIDAKLYTVLRTFAFFTKASKAEDANYSTEVHKNSFDIKEAKINAKLLGNLILSSLEVDASSRKPFADLSAPLTRKVFKRNADKSSEIWSQNFTAGWFSGYSKKKSGIDKFVAYAYYRYVEVIAMIALAVTLLTLDQRIVAQNVLYIIGILVFSVVASMYLRRVGKAAWLFGIAAYGATIAYILFFLGAMPSGFWQWFIAIIAFEPIVEMLIADAYMLLKKSKPKKRTAKKT